MVTDVVTRQRLVDAVAAVAVAAALCLRAAAPFEGEAMPPDWRAYSLMIAIGMLLLVRRRYPLAVLLGSLAALLIYYMLGFGAVGATWPLAPALFNAALLGQWQAATWTSAGLIVGSSIWRLLIEREGDLLITISDVVTEVVTATAVILAGAMIRNHRLLRAEMRAREEAVAAERDAEARTRVTEERLRIARDVHDIVAHSLAGIGVQAHLAEELIGADSIEAKRAIRSIIATTGDAMTQLRQTVGTLRKTPATPPTLQDMARGLSGVEVELVEKGTSALGDEPSETALRSIVREALTNVVRHSGGRKALVTVDRRPDRLVIEVRDDGRPGDFEEGTGIRGMRERAAAVGGTLDATSTPDGFVIVAELPR